MNVLSSWHGGVCGSWSTNAVSSGKTSQFFPSFPTAETRELACSLLLLRTESSLTVQKQWKKSHFPLNAHSQVKPSPLRKNILRFIKYGYKRPMEIIWSTCSAQNRAKFQARLGCSGFHPAQFFFIIRIHNHCFCADPLALVVILVHFSFFTFW